MFVSLPSLIDFDEFPFLLPIKTFQSLQHVLLKARDHLALTYVCIWLSPACLVAVSHLKTLCRLSLTPEISRAPFPGLDQSALCRTLWIMLQGPEKEALLWECLVSHLDYIFDPPICDCTFLCYSTYHTLLLTLVNCLSSQQHVNPSKAGILSIWFIIRALRK